MSNLQSKPGRSWLLALLVFATAYTNHAWSQSMYAWNENKTAGYKSSGGINGKQPAAKQTLYVVLKELNRKKGAYFLFSDPSLADRPVNNVSSMNEETERILDLILKNTGLKYKKISVNIFVILQSKENSRKVDAHPVNFSQGDPGDEVAMNFLNLQSVISGKVTDKDGNPVPGVSVSIKGTNKGTTTNTAGNFSIDANKGDVLVFSSVNFEKQEVPVGDSNSLDVTLTLSTQQMNEVVVTALGVKREKRSLGYSSQKVDGEELTKSRQINVINSLEGKVAGVQINQTGNGPAGSSRIVIRGNNFLSENNQPLIVVDGIPMDNFQTATNQSEYGSFDAGNGIADINPDDIESVNILK